MRRLSVQLSLAFLLASWIGVGAMYLVVQRMLDTGFRHYLQTRESEVSADQITRLENYYVVNGSWAGAETVLGGRGAGAGNGRGNSNNNANNAGRGATLSVVDMQAIIVASTDEILIGQAVDADLLSTALSLMVNDRQVGWLIRQTPSIQALGVAEVAFLAESNRWLTLAGVGAIVLAIVVGGALAWTLAHPLRKLTSAVRDLSIGQLGRQVHVNGTVEINSLVHAFNSMSAALANGEALRQRMAADIAHELRTPVSVLRGHLEAMLDGVYPCDSAHLAVAHNQTMHLGRLVEDLRLLTLAEAKRLPLEFTDMAVNSLIVQVLEAFEPLALDSEIRFTVNLAPNLPLVHADPVRIRQVLSNLLNNALRHTPVQGDIGVTVQHESNFVRFDVSNTGSTLSAAEIQQIFQPFWRAAETRQRDNSGSGLGLAISREIIHLHGGTMQAQYTGQRVIFSFTLPIAGKVSTPTVGNLDRPVKESTLSAIIRRN